MADLCHGRLRVNCGSPDPYNRESAAPTLATSPPRPASAITSIHDVRTRTATARHNSSVSQRWWKATFGL
jgi:hypothetical protein